MPDSDWRMPRGEHSTTWQKGMKSVTKGLGSMGVTDSLGGVHVILLMFGFRPCKTWLLTEVSGVCAVSFYPVRVIECLEV